MDQMRIAEIQSRKLIQGLYGRMAERLLRHCCREDRGENVFLSPLPAFPFVLFCSRSSHV